MCFFEAKFWNLPQVSFSFSELNVFFFQFSREGIWGGSPNFCIQTIIALHIFFFLEFLVLGCFGVVGFLLGLET